MDILLKLLHDYQCSLYIWNNYIVLYDNHFWYIFSIRVTHNVYIFPPPNPLLYIYIHSVKSTWLHPSLVQIQTRPHNMLRWILSNGCLLTNEFYPILERSTLILCSQFWLPDYFSYLSWSNRINHVFLAVVCLCLRILYFSSHKPSCWPPLLILF